jgi:hypothetical protein
MKGLELFGFRLSDRKNRGPWIKAAFIAFYDHLDSHLTDADKAELHLEQCFLNTSSARLADLNPSSTTIKIRSV